MRRKGVPAYVKNGVLAALAEAWDEGHQQGVTDAASYDMGGKYQGNPYKDE